MKSPENRTWRKLRRSFRETRSAARHFWWRITSERQRTIEERDQYKAAAELRFKQMVEYRDALYELKADHLPGSIDVLRIVADEIDCEPGCESVGPMDPSTGVVECPRSNGGDCPFDKACQLRDLAAALETYALARKNESVS